MYSVLNSDFSVVKNENIMEKKVTYISPQIDLIVLDNEISLVLESTPPLGPDEIAQQQNTNLWKQNDTFNS